jgi:hypothetical protein
MKLFESRGKTLHALLVVCATLLGGCARQLGTMSAAPGGTAQPTGSALTGRVHGGQQPVSGANIELFATGSSGYGSAAATLLTSSVQTGSDGSFNITADYTCPSPSTLVYLTATGGNPGLAGNVNNPALALMAALGPCGALQSTTFISVNELTTVAGVWALSHYMTGYSAIGSSSTNTTGIASAFAAANEVVSLATGTVPGASLPAGATLPVAKLNSLANILAACVNSSGGVAGDGSSCGNLFAAATPSGGSAPIDTMVAAMNIARNPGSNVSAVFSLGSANAPFQPALSTPPTDWLIGINYTGGGLSSPKSVVVDGSGNIWVANGGSNSVSEFSSIGTALSPVSGYTGGGLNQPAAIAIDPNGNAWVANSGGNSVSEFSSNGSALSPVAGFTGGGLSTPQSISIDGYGEIWLGNHGNGSVTELNSSGMALSPAAGYTGAGVNAPVGIAVNPH